MTGRELIVYILENHLEDVDVFKDGKIAFLISEDEIAIALGVGVATVRAWFYSGMLKGVKIAERVYIVPPKDSDWRYSGLLEKGDRDHEK